MGKIKTVSRAEMEYVLSDFWMIADYSSFYSSFGPCVGAGLNGEQKQYETSVHELLTSIDSKGKSEVLIGIARRYLVERDMPLEDISAQNPLQHIEETLSGIKDKLRVTYVNYRSQILSGLQGMVGFKWEKFEKMGRPKFIRGESKIITFYEGIEEISPNYQARR